MVLKCRAPLSEVLCSHSGGWSSFTLPNTACPRNPKGSGNTVRELLLKNREKEL